MKNKTLPILCIFILLSFIFINNVFAVSYDLSDYKNHVSGSNWFILYSTDNDKFYLITGMYAYFYLDGLSLNEDGNYTTNGGVVNSSLCSNSPWSRMGDTYVRTFDPNTSTFGSSVSYGVNDTARFNAGHSIVVASGMTIYKLQDISIFFQATPVPSQVVIPSETTQVEIPALETVEQIPEMIVTTLKLIIPVGLVVLSVVLVIYLARRVIYQSL